MEYAMLFHTCVTKFMNEIVFSKADAVGCIKD
jgi:hypothetical protein